MTLLLLLFSLYLKYIKITYLVISIADLFLGLVFKEQKMYRTV